MATTYKTIQGDMWDSIAYKVYGDEKHMSLLAEANGQYLDTLVFSAGVELTVPDLPDQVDDSLPFWRNVE